MSESEISDECPHVDMTISEDGEQLNQDLLDLFETIRPEWKRDEITMKLSPKEVSRGLMNTMVKCFWKEFPDQAIMARAYNPKTQWMDRAIEAKCLKHLKDKNCCPTIIATFNNGFCYNFIEGRILSHPDISQEPIWRHAAKQIGKINSGTITSEETLSADKPALLAIRSKLLSVYPDEMKDPAKNERFKREFPPKEELEKELNLVMDHAVSTGSPVILCHHDTRPENIIWNEDTGVLKFVDFEAISYDYQAYELANHFCRFGGLEPTDYTLYPNKEFQLKWLRVYLDQWHKSSGRADKVVTEKELETVYVQVQKFYLVALILSVICGPAMADAMQMDILSFAVSALEEYRKVKDRIMAMELP